MDYDGNELFDMILLRHGCSGGLTLRVVKEHLAVDDDEPDTVEVTMGILIAPDGTEAKVPHYH